MDWIKKHYDQFSLAIISVAVLALAILLYLKTQSFGERFGDALSQPPQGDKVPPIVLDQIDRANSMLAKPPVWTAPAPDRASERGSLFVSEHYMLDPSGNPSRPATGSIYSDSLTGQPIPNLWFLDNNLPLFDTGVRLQDPDGDGFPNEVEWRLHTDPGNKDSHPPYYAMLFLKQVIPVRFRVKLSSYDGDIKKDPTGKTFDFFLNTIDLGRRTEVLKIGDTIPTTHFKLEKFEYKVAKNPKTDEEEEVSELTVINTETNDRAVLVYNRIVDSPEFRVLFDYEWPEPAQGALKPIEFQVKKAGEFVLRPNLKDRYKLIDIKENAAVIQLPDGQTAPDGSNKVEITRDPRKK